MDSTPTSARTIRILTAEQKPLEMKSVPFPEVDESQRSLHTDVAFSEPCAKFCPNKRRSFRSKFPVFKFLEYPEGSKAKTYHSFVFILTLSILIGTVLSTVESLFSTAFLWTYICMVRVFAPDILSPTQEIMVVSIFVVEYSLRVWSCTALDIYSGWRVVRFMVKPFMVIDLIVILSSICMISLFFITSISNKDIILFLKAIQVLRFFHFERYHGSVKLMTTVLYVHRNELLTGYCASMMLILFTAFIIYIAEKDSISNEMRNIPESIYFSVISFLTIGYGDVVPTTAAAKILIVLLAFLGVALAAVPSGIIGSGFALQVASRAKKRQKKQVRKPAVILIQRASRSHLYHNIDNSAVEKLDYMRVLGNPKNKSFPLWKDPKKTCDDSATIHMNNPIEEFIHDLPQDSQLTVTSHDALSFAQKKKRTINFGKTWNPKPHKKSNSHSVTPDMPRLIRICARFVRNLQLELAKKKFRISKHPASVEDLLEEFGISQKKISYQLEDIKESVKAWRGRPHKRSLSPSSAMNFSKPSMDPETLCRLACIESKIACIEDSLQKILQRLS